MRDGDIFGLWFGTRLSHRPGFEALLESPGQPYLGDQAGKLEVSGEGDVEDCAVGIFTPVLQRRLHGHPPPAALDDEDGGVEGEAEGRAVRRCPPQRPPAEIPAGGRQRCRRALPAAPCPDPAPGFFYAPCV